MPDYTAARLAVINEAFAGIKANRIESFDETLEGVEDIERKYLTTVLTVLTHPSLPPSMQRVALARQDAAMGHPYDYTSPIGGDIVAIYDSATTMSPYTDFRIVGGKVNTDIEAAWADVLVGSEPETWPPYMRKAIVAALEADFAFDATGDIALARYKTALAYGAGDDFPDGGLVGAARKRSAQQQGGGVLVMGASELTSARYR